MCFWLVLWARSLAVMTSPLHGEGHQFEREAKELFSESLVGPILFSHFVEQRLLNQA